MSTDEKKGDHKTKVLVFSADAVDAGRVQLQEMWKAVETKLDWAAAQKESKIALIPALAVEPKQLLDHLIRREPQIVHFIGHGEPTALGFQTADGKVVGISADAFINSLAASEVKAVVITCCNSAAIAVKASAKIPFAIGTTGKITNESAIAFSFRFYSCLALGHTVKKAFNFSVLEVANSGKEDESLLFELHVKKGEDAAAILA
jgi:hypothetical protein